MLHNSICTHKSNNYYPLSVPDLINVLKTLQDKLSSLVHCQRDRTPDIFDALKELEKSNSIQVFSIVKDFTSVRKQNSPDLLNQLKPIHQRSGSELKNIDFILRKVIVPQLPLKTDKNDLVSVQERSKGDERHFFAFVSPRLFPLLCLCPPFNDWLISQ